MRPSVVELETGELLETVLDPNLVEPCSMKLFKPILVFFAMNKKQSLFLSKTNFIMDTFSDLKTLEAARIMKHEATKLRETHLLMSEEERDQHSVVEEVSVCLKRGQVLIILADKLDENADKLFAYVKPTTQNESSQ